MPIISVPTFYLTRDITGSLSDNLITNERHTVQDLPFRIIVPNFGGFYVDDLIVNSINTTTNVSTLLVKDVDYKCLEVDILDTAETGKEVAHVILINKVTNDLTFDITYQAIGGSNSPNISVLMQAFDDLNINNKVRNWLDVAHKPDAYPPNDHRHDSADIYGLEYIVKALDNIKNAVTDASYDLIHQYLIEKIKIKLDNYSPIISDAINNKLDTVSILTDKSEKTLIYTYSQFLEVSRKLDEVKFELDRINNICNNYKNNKYDSVYANLLTTLARRQSKENVLILNTPSRIEDLELWLDADDLSTIATLPNQTTWTDKSLNQRQYVTSGAAKPTYNSAASNHGKCFEFITGKYFNKSTGRDLIIGPNMTIICITYYLLSPNTNNNSVLFSNSSGFAIYGNVNATRTFKTVNAALEVNIANNNNTFPKINILALSKDIENSYTSSINLTTKQELTATINPLLNLSILNATLNTIGSPTLVQSSAISQILVYNRRLAKCEIDCIVEYFYRRNKT